LEALARRITRVCLTGPECTGKTTLARRLAEHFGTLWVPEFAREYALGVARPLTLTDVDLIARGQMAGEDLTLLDADRLLFLDTDLVSTVVYSNYYYSAVPQWVTTEARRRLADLYLLADIDVPFELDPARDAEEHRIAHAHAFRRTLDELGARYIILSGEGEARLQRAIEAVEALANLD
jgi:NadR type nicotinamide-nucleotide adenylyltransferase